MKTRNALGQYSAEYVTSPYIGAHSEIIWCAIDEVSV